MKANVPQPVQLRLDMKVQWSSTYLMLDRAERNKAVRTYLIAAVDVIHEALKHVDNFVEELRWEEADSIKRDKIRELKLTSGEWGRVALFLGLLGVCQDLSSFDRNSDTVLACRQCSACVFIKQSTHSFSCHSSTRSPAQGLVVSCRPPQV